MDVLFLVGRLFFGGIVIFSEFIHFTKRGEMSA